MRVLAALAAAVALAGCGSVPNAVTGGGRVVGDNLTIYASVPDPARGVGRDMVDASKLAIAEAGGRVGDLGINFVAIDEGSPGAPDPPRVAGAAAEQAIRDTQLIAVVGAVRSDTAMTSLPLFNAAGILLVSPGAGYAGFTEPVAAGEPDRWYPSGRRTFARVIEDDTEQAQALLRAAGRGKVAIEGEVGKVAAEQVEALQEAAGDRIVEDVRRADAVIYVGSDVANAQGVAESLAREVPRARLVFGDELTRAGLSRRLDPAARRRAVFVTAAPEPGSEPEFETAFEQEFGRAPDPYAALTWRATKGVLDALAAAGRRANLRRVVAERYLADPVPPSGFSAFQIRGGEREYL